ncbi:chitin synthase regulator 3, partial [Melampsora americana]
PKLISNLSHPNPTPPYSPITRQQSPSNRKISIPVVDLELLNQQYDDYFHIHDPFNQTKWSGKVLKFIEKSQSEPKPSSEHSNATTTTRISDPLLVKYTDIALKTILKHASASQPVPEALYLRADLASTGSFPSYKSKDLKMAFRDFEAAANLGYKLAWFRIGREYEAFEDWDRAVGAYEHGMSLGDCASIYRLGMSYFLGQLQLPADVVKAVAHLKSAADLADEDTPQPAYIYGMLLAGDFESLPQISSDVLKPNPIEARQLIEKAAYLGFAAAQYKMGWLYEYSQLGCPFDPLLSVEYYTSASKQGEIEADMALSKWFLCGADGYFSPNESLAVTFADKAARRNLPSAMFALGYYYEIGIGGRPDLDLAKKWYEKAYREGNNLDAKNRLECLETGGARLSRNEHENNIDLKLVRKHTLAAQRSGLKTLPPSKKESMKQVEEVKKVAGMGGMNPGALSQSSAQFSSRSPSPLHLEDSNRVISPPPSFNHQAPGSQFQGGGRQPSRVQLTDDGPMSPPKSITTTTKPAQSTPSRPTNTTTFNSFADMGIQTAKAKKTEDCLIM